VIYVSECLNTVAAGTLLGSGDGGRKIPHPPAITRVLKHASVDERKIIK
jgi:hypothetical protein